MSNHDVKLNMIKFEVIDKNNEIVKMCQKLMKLSKLMSKINENDTIH